MFNHEGILAEKKEWRTGAPAACGGFIFCRTVSREMIAPTGAAAVLHGSL